MKKSLITLLAVLGVMVTSCSKVIKTAQHADVSTNVSSYPTVGDLHISPQRVSKTVSWKWNPFNTTSLKARRDNVKADLIKEAGADILVEPAFTQRTSFCNLLGGSLTVSGYPATLDNFRTATPEDIVALRIAGTMKINHPDAGVCIVINQDDINGVVFGLPVQDSIPEVTADENLTNAIAQTEESKVAAETETKVTAEPKENAIPADPVAETSQYVHKSSSRLDNVSRLTGRHNSGSSMTGETSSGASLTGSHPVLNKSTGSNTNTNTSKQQEETSSSSPSSSYSPIAYDKIGKDRFLITMSKDYYGDPNFWPYIYEENRVKFGHPDKIRPGSSVTIPNLKKYGVDPKNPADVEKAKKLAKEIYARYGVNI